MIERWRSTAAFALFAVTSSSAAAYAHDSGARVALSPWTPAPWLWLGLAASVTLYARGYAVLRGRLGATLRGAPKRAVYFGLSIATLVVALVSPLDAWSDRLFSAHMIQHELLMLVAAPLLVLARPLEPYFWSLPSPARTRVLAVVRAPPFVSIFRAFMTPWLALLLHGAVRWLWHIPALFEACLHDEFLHGVQHASFFVTAMLFWWSVLQGVHGRFGYGVAVIFVFATALHTGALGALITFARHPFYPDQTQAAVTGIDALTDQQLAGFIMWIVAGTWLTALGLALFVVWLGQSSHRKRANHFDATGQTATR